MSNFPNQRGEPKRRKLLRQSWQICTAGMLVGWFGLRETFAATDPRPEFASRRIDDVLDFCFGTSTASDDASIQITVPLVVQHQQLVPFRINAPGAQKIAVLTDTNPEPLVMTAERTAGNTGILIGQARMGSSGNLACFVMRNGVLGRAVRRVSVAGSWREVSQ